MKTLAYLDCPTGISGDMCLGALVHAGVPLAYLIEQLTKLGISEEFQLRAESVQRNQQAATRVHVDLRPVFDHSHGHHHSHEHSSAHGYGHNHGHQHSYGHSHESEALDHAHAHESAHAHGHTQDQWQPHSHHHTASSHHASSHHHATASRRLPEIEAMILQASFPERVAQWSLATFRTLAKAEATVHGIPPDQVHFHEVGATDAIVDIVGTCLGFDWLNVDALICSALPTGGGTVRCDHGLLPVPAPAVLAMLSSAKVPVFSNGINKELVTPTGCAIATTLATTFGPPPAFTLTKVGLGAGGRDLKIPNILRLWLGNSTSQFSLAQSSSIEQSSLAQSFSGQSSLVNQAGTHESMAQSPADSPPQTETVTQLQTQIDDASPQAIGYLFEQLFAMGALDVYTQPIAMKKNRLGTLLTVLCNDATASQCEALIFRESTTLGIRRTQQTRTVLDREIISVSTPYGNIPVKVARRNGQVLNVQPEYDNCAEVARSHDIPWKQIHQAALKAASEQIITAPAASPTPVLPASAPL